MTDYRAEDRPRQPWEEKLRGAASHVEADLKRVIGYINDEVMPDVRRNGSSALRAAAMELERLAERMERASTGEPAPPGRTPEPPPRV